MPGTGYAIRSNTFFSAQSPGNNLRLDGTHPEVRLNETDRTSPAGRHRLIASGGDLFLQRLTGLDLTEPEWTGLNIAANILQATNTAIVLGEAGDAGTFDVQIAKGRKLQSNSSIEIGIQVQNDALTTGSLGTLRGPVKTTTGAPVDSEFGNLDGCIGYNSFDNTLEVRDGANTYLSVGLAGQVLQRRAPRIQDGSGQYHPAQELDPEFVNEARCYWCGGEIRPDDMVALAPNGYVRNGDVHAIYGHLHLERLPLVQAIIQKLNSLEGGLRALLHAHTRHPLDMTPAPTPGRELPSQTDNQEEDHG